MFHPGWAQMYWNTSQPLPDLYLNPLRRTLLQAGTLITAPLGRKFLLTADHCFVGKYTFCASAWHFLTNLLSCTLFCLSVQS